jgi:Ca-activated chloride channel homolog
MPLVLTPDFALLRPAWLLALPLLLLLALRFRHAGEGKAAEGGWASLIDTHLQAQLLTSAASTAPTTGRRPRWRLPLAAALAIFALAGPALHAPEGAHPVLRPAVTRLFLVDLSARFAALPETRQARTRLKLRALLGVLPAADSGLVVHDHDAFLVVPPTTDSDSLARWLPELSASAMPTGSVGKTAEFSDALRLAGEVLQRHGGRPELIWVSATPVGELEAFLAAAREARALPGGTAVRILQIAEGAPASPPATGAAEMTVVSMSADESDLQALAAASGRGDWRRGGDRDRGPGGWQDLGPWLLLALLPVAATMLATPATGSLALAIVLAIGSGVLASDMAVAATANDARWQAVAAYRAGDYARAAARLAEFADADSLYNRGNALARLGRLQEALAAYDAALAQRPGDPDVRHNRDLVASLLKSPPPPPKPPKPSAKPPEGAEQQEAQRAAEQWLRRVPDTPPASGDSLLKRKLAIEAASRDRQPTGPARPPR